MQKKTKQLQIILLCSALIFPGFLGGSCGKKIEGKSIDSNTDNGAFIQDEQEPRDEVTSPIDKSSKLTDKELLGSKIKRCQTLNKQAENQENDQKGLYNVQDRADNDQLANNLANILSNNNISSLSERKRTTLFAQKRSLLANSPAESTKEERLQRFERLVKRIRHLKNRLEKDIERINVISNTKKNKDSKIFKKLLIQKKEIKKKIEDLYSLLPSIKGNLKSIENSENIFAEIQNKYYYINNSTKPT